MGGGINQTKMGFKRVISETIYQHFTLYSQADKHSIKQEIQGKINASKIT
jgi:hypothetical protein